MQPFATCGKLTATLDESSHAQLLPSVHCRGRICRCRFVLRTGAITDATCRQGCPGGRCRAYSFTQHFRGSFVSWVDHLAPRCCLGVSRRRLHQSRCSVDSSRSTSELTRLDLPTAARSEPDGLRGHANLRVHIRAESPSVTAVNSKLFNKSCLESNGYPVATLFHIYACKPIVAAVILAVFHSFLDCPSSHDGRVVVHTYVQVGNLT